MLIRKYFSRENGLRYFLREGDSSFELVEQTSEGEHILRKVGYNPDCEDSRDYALSRIFELANNHMEIEYLN